MVHLLFVFGLSNFLYTNNNANVKYSLLPGEIAEKSCFLFDNLL
jgi:hypothetical protein